MLGLCLPASLLACLFPLVGGSSIDCVHSFLRVGFVRGGGDVLAEQQAQEAGFNEVR